MTKLVELPEWASFIIGSAIAEIAGGRSDEEVIEKAKGTALYARTDYWKAFLRIVKTRREIANKYGRH